MRPGLSHPRPSRPIRRVALFLALPLLVSLACTTLLGGPPPATLPPAVTVSADTPAPGQPTRAATAASTPEPLVFGPGPFNLPDATAHLADLSSYQARLTLSFAGASQNWSKTYTLLSAQAPAARQLIVDRAGDLPELSALYLAEVNGVAYQLRGENTCAAVAFKPDESPIQPLEPARLLTGVIGADDAGSETVNDMPANHYTFDERALGLLGLAKATGELWVAADGGYLVKYALTTTGGADYFGADTAGTLTWDYELTRVNQPAPISLPADCPAGLVDAPRLPDAAHIRDLPGLLAYDSASSLAGAITFYQDQLPPLGWQLAGEPLDAAALAADQTTVVLSFTQANQTLTVILAAGQSNTSVTLLLDRAPQ